MCYPSAHRPDVLRDGDALRTGVVVFGDSGAGLLIVVAHEVGGDAVDGLGDSSAVTVILEGGGYCDRVL